MYGFNYHGYEAERNLCEIQFYDANMDKEDRKRWGYLVGPKLPRGEATRLVDQLNALTVGGLRYEIYCPQDLRRGCSHYNCTCPSPGRDCATYGGTRSSLGLTIETVMLWLQVAKIPA